MGLGTEEWKVVIAGLALLSNIIAMTAGGYAWAVARRQARKSEVDQGFEKVHGRIDEAGQAHANLRERVSSIETHIRQLPDNSTVSDLHILVERLRGDVTGLNKELEGFKELSNVMNRQVEMMDTYLREGSRHGG